MNTTEKNQTAEEKAEGWRAASRFIADIRRRYFPKRMVEQSPETHSGQSDDSPPQADRQQSDLQ